MFGNSHDRDNPLAFVVGWDAWDAYDQYISDKQVKYSENTEVNRYRFKGKSRSTLALYIYASISDIPQNRPYPQETKVF